MQGASTQNFRTPHHDGSALHVSPVAPRLGETVTLRLRVPAERPADAVGVRAVLDAEGRMLPADLLGIAGGDEWWTVTVPMHNPVVRYSWLVVRGEEHEWVTADGTGPEERRDADAFVLAADTDVPAWADDAVLYQVFPDRFARSATADQRTLPDWAEPAAWGDDVVHQGPGTPRQFYGGDLDGVAEHLDHLERLGVTVLYLTPVFPARSNHRYDASSFDHVDPLLGGDEALVRLVEAAHARGIRVLGDLTTNHCGAGHEWFKAAHRAPGAAESDFFFWLDDRQEEYVGWLGHASLPKFDWRSPELRRRFIDGPGSVVGRWLQPPFQLDGWRIDVANMTGRYADVDLNEEVRRTIRATMRAVNVDTLLLAEHTVDAATDLTGDAWHGAMTYPSFTRPLWGWLMERNKPTYEAAVSDLPFPTIDGAAFAAANRRFTTGYPWPMRLANLNALDSHDTPRLAGTERPDTLHVAWGLAVTLPGIPFLWAGDELGLPAADGEHSRTPMPWSRLDEYDELITAFADLIALRHAHGALRHGGMKWLHAGADILVFLREAEDESVLVVASRAAAEAIVQVPNWDSSQRLGGTTSARIDDGLVTLSSTGPDIALWQLPGVQMPQPGLRGRPEPRKEP